ncbi:hypothetical protein PInf_010982 [Phytophthora infestans]|nr:hypothetical protein PInf_010982 [Phytophthora infestans]
MTPSSQSSRPSTKHLLTSTLMALAACSTTHAAVANTTSSVDHATFGDITSGSSKCVIGSPNTGGVTREQIDWVWENTMKEYVTTPAFQNLIFDQLVNNKGKLSYCVRWENDKKLTKAVASKFQAMIEQQINLWNRWLVGYNCCPIDKIDITVVGFAEGNPQCPDDCYKHRGQAANADTSGCKGEPFDMSLWPSTSPGENAVGTGGDWGQRIEVNHFLDNLDQEQQMTMLHEIGHGFGLPEMYVSANKPADYPECVMDEGATMTDGDGWLLRSILENIRSRLMY